MPVVVPAALHLGPFADVAPGRAKGRDRMGGIFRARFAEGKDVPLGLGLAELLSIPDGVFAQYRIQGGVQRNRSALVRLRLAAANGIDLRPGQAAQFLAAQNRGIEPTGWRQFL